MGELLRLGAARGRAARDDLTLSICGEHGGSPEAIRFCRDLGFDYVSCSPFRVPVARLAAAQLVIAGARLTARGGLSRRISLAVIVMLNDAWTGRAHPVRQ